MLLSANKKVECAPSVGETVSFERKGEVQPTLGHVIFRLLKSRHLKSQLLYNAHTELITFYEPMVMYKIPTIYNVSQYVL
jgi:hypothetical protein